MELGNKRRVDWWDTVDCMATLSVFREYFAW